MIKMIEKALFTSYNQCFKIAQLADLKQQLGMMDARASQLLLDDDELDEANLLFIKEGGSKSSQFSTATSAYSVSNMTSSGRTNVDNKQKHDLRKLDREKREQLEVSKFNTFLNILAN